MKRLLIIASLMLAACQTTLVSEGDRIGQVTKLSHKMLCSGSPWSWEGELAMMGGTLASGQGVDGNAVGAWAFTVKEDKLAASLQELLGRNVRLHYQQYENRNTCEMGSEYLVTAVQSLEK